MKPKNKFSFRERIISFNYAISGIKLMFNSEHNSWIHFIATIIVILLGFLFNVSKIEWCFLIIAIGMVLIAEIFNTSIERLANRVDEKFCPLIKESKDLAAGGVLISSIVAIIIAIIVFLN
jgi:diacylglycerol kinase (ATP)